jgi:hypothetical protein
MYVGAVALAIEGSVSFTSPPAPPSLNVTEPALAVPVKYTAFKRAGPFTYVALAVLAAELTSYCIPIINLQKVK